MAHAELEIRIQFLYAEPTDAPAGESSTDVDVRELRHGAPNSDAPGNGRFRIEARFNHSENDVEYVRESVESTIDLAALPDPHDDTAAYGHALWGHLFEQAKLKSLLDLATSRASGIGVPLRVRLYVDYKDARLHRLHWELLRDPAKELPLAADEQVLFSRYISSEDTRDVRLRPRGMLHALVVIANPRDLERDRLHPIDVASEEQRARQSLKGITVQVLPSGGEATVENLLDHLRKQQYDILYLVCHGRIVQGEPWMWLEKATGEGHRVSGDHLAVRIGRLSQRPSLVVLASCESAGGGSETRRNDRDALVAVGPKLIAQGIPAVLGMQGSVTITTAERFVSRFFEELLRDGHIDHAMTVARGSVLERHDWWLPVLFSRLKGGHLWYTPGFAKGGADEEMWTALIERVRRGSCTPILGPGLTDGLLGSRREVALSWAQAHHFPMPLHQHESLPQVAQFLEVYRAGAFVRDQFVDQLAAEVCKRYRDRIPELMALCPDDRVNFTGKELSELISVVGRWQRREDPNEPHQILAGLNLKIFVTANVSDLMADALGDADKSPHVDHCRWKDDVKRAEDPSEATEHEPSVAEPLVYHLYGRLDKPREVVFTEDDYFKYLIKVASNGHMVPKRVSEALLDSTLLFLGFNLDDWTFRVLYQLILNQQGQKLFLEHHHVAVQVDPEQGRAQSPERVRQYFERYFGMNKISLFWGSTQDFMEELARRLDNAR